MARSNKKNRDIQAALAKKAARKPSEAAGPSTTVPQPIINILKMGFAKLPKKPDFVAEPNKKFMKAKNLNIADQSSDKPSRRAERPRPRARNTVKPLNQIIRDLFELIDPIHDLMFDDRLHELVPHEFRRFNERFDQLWPAVFARTDCWARIKNSVMDQFPAWFRTLLDQLAHKWNMDILYRCRYENHGHAQSK